MMKSTCYFNESMPYCPVQVQVGRQIIKQLNGTKYLLQVWSSENVKVYERPL
jgi:hypothetical protein